MRNFVCCLFVTGLLAGCGSSWLPAEGARPDVRPITLDEAMIYANALGIELDGAARFDELTPERKLALCYFAVYRLNTPINAASEAICADILPGLQPAADGPPPASVIPVPEPKPVMGEPSAFLSGAKTRLTA